MTLLRRQACQRPCTHLQSSARDLWLCATALLTEARPYSDPNLDCTLALTVIQTLIRTYARCMILASCRVAISVVNVGSEQLQNMCCRRICLWPSTRTMCRIAHYMEPGFRAGQRRYSMSKLLNVYCAYEMARRLAASQDARLRSVRVNAVDPGKRLHGIRPWRELRLLLSQLALYVSTLPSGRVDMVIQLQSAVMRTRHALPRRGIMVDPSSCCACQTSNSH